MASVNNDVTVTLSQEDKDLLIAAIKKCKEIAKDCNYNSDMWLGADIVFAEIYDEYKNGELPSIGRSHRESNKFTFWEDPKEDK